MRFLIVPRELPQSAEAADSGSCDHRADEFDETLFSAYMAYNEELTRAGVLIAAEGLSPLAPPVQVGVRGGQRRVIDGPFAETKELVGGFYLIDVASMEEAVGWALKCPAGAGHEVLVVHQLTELGDLPPRLQELIRTGAPQWSAARWPMRQ